MKPKNWRIYYGPRPSYAHLGKLSDDTIRRQAGDYLDWLAKSRQWSKREASDYANAQPLGALVSSAAERDANVRQEEYLGDGVTIRTMRAVSAAAREHYAPEANKWQRFKDRPYSFSDDLPKSAGVTTYAVIVAGRCVNSFLSKARAKQWARAELAQSTYRKAA